jgi:membrane protease YdiL (CAAX protease family)
MINPEPLQVNEEENGSVEQGNNQTSVRIFEFFMVVCVAFGYSIWYSIYPLFVESRNDQVTRIASLTLQIVLALALLGYVLCRRQQLVSNTASLVSSQDSGQALPFCLTRKLTSSIQHVHIFEWGLILMLAFWQPVFNLAYAWVTDVDYDRGLTGALAANVDQLRGMLRDALALCVLGYVLYRRQRSFSDIGLRWSAKDAALALPLFLFGILSSAVQRPLVDGLGQIFGQPGWHPPNIGAIFFGTEDIPVAVVPSWFLNGFNEELIVRAFVMTEVIKLTRRTWLAVVISVSIQTSYHFYQGVPIALSHIAIFTIYSLFYARTRLILPVALAHSLLDLGYVWDHGLWIISH